jgi:hypothetical protein
MSSRVVAACWLAGRMAVAIAATAFFNAAQAQSPAQIQRAERVGLELFLAHERASVAGAGTSIAESANVERCSAPYRTVVISPKVVYLVADPSHGIAVGRHYRVELAGEERIGAVVPSTQTCLLIDEPPASASAGATRPSRILLSHTLTSAPDEFHVFLSLKHDKPIYVMTRTGGWKVEAGLITRIN